MAKLKVTKKELTGPQMGYDPIYGVGLWGDIGGTLPHAGYNKPAEYGVLVDPSQYYNSWEYKLYLMRQDPTIALLRQLWIAPIMSAGWRVDAEDDVSDDVINYATEEMDRIHEDIIPQAGLGCLDWGWAPFEKVYKLRSDGLLGIDKLKSLLQQMTLILSNPQTGEYEGLSQADMYTNDQQQIGMVDARPAASNLNPILTLDHALLFNFDVIGTNWYGQAPMRAAERPYDSSCQVDTSKAKLNLRMAGEHWVIYYPVGTTEQADGTMLDNSVLAAQIMEQMLNNGSATLPNEIRSELNILNGDAGSDEYQSWRIELLSSGDGSANYYLEQNKYNDNLKARALGFPERAVFEGQFGTKAEAEVHADLAVQGLEKRSQQLTQCVSEQVLKPLLEFNFGEEAAEKVCLKANPIVDTAMVMFTRLYEKFLTNPDVLIEEFDNINMREVREKLRIPQFEEGQENPEPLRDEIDDRAPEMDPNAEPGDEKDDDEPQELSAYAFADCGTGAGGFKPGNTCATGKKKDVDLSKLTDGTRTGESVDAKRIEKQNNIESPLDDVDDPIFGEDNKRRNFKEWFSGSKVVDEDGNPLVVFKGTTFDENEKTFGGDSWFTSARETASQFAGRGSEYYPYRINPETGEEGVSVETFKDKGRIYPVYLSIKNPRVISHDVTMWDSTKEKAQIEIAKANGNDGLIIEYDIDKTDYVTFAPTQIKSAIGNKGTFDPDNPDIRFSE